LRTCGPAWSATGGADRPRRSAACSSATWTARRQRPVHTGRCQEPAQDPAQPPLTPRSSRTTAERCHCSMSAELAAVQRSALIVFGAPSCHRRSGPTPIATCRTLAIRIPAHPRLSGWTARSQRGGWGGVVSWQGSWAREPGMTGRCSTCRPGTLEHAADRRGPVRSPRSRAATVRNCRLPPCTAPAALLDHVQGTGTRCIGHPPARQSLGGIGSSSRSTSSVRRHPVPPPARTGWPPSRPGRPA